MAVNTPVVVRGKLSVRDEKPPQIMCDTIYPLNTENLPPVAAKPQEPKNAALFLIRKILPFVNKGLKNSEICQSSLPRSVRLKADRLIAAHRQELVRRAQVRSRDAPKR